MVNKKHIEARWGRQRSFFKICNGTSFSGNDRLTDYSRIEVHYDAGSESLAGMWAFKGEIRNVALSSKLFLVLQILQFCIWPQHLSASTFDRVS